mgnify:CR=1 FL=1
MEELNEQTVSSVAYTEENIRHLSDMEHVRTRPGMYIGRLGDGSQVEDGILCAVERSRRQQYRRVQDGSRKTH